MNGSIFFGAFPFERAPSMLPSVRSLALSFWAEVIIPSLLSCFFESLLAATGRFVRSFGALLLVSGWYSRRTVLMPSLPSTREFESSRCPLSATSNAFSCSDVPMRLGKLRGKKVES